MQKAKKYDWRDSNMALFGSDTENKVKSYHHASEEEGRPRQRAPDRSPTNQPLAPVTVQPKRRKWIRRYPPSSHDRDAPPDEGNGNREESAESEKAWKATQDLEGTQAVVFRVVKFKIEEWEKEQYGEFYSGDSYIVYHQTKKPDEDKLDKDIHFWIGKHSTQDEYGTAAYKTVELDTLHDDEPIQHREVQGHESALFKSYFDNLQILKGGADTGFRRVLPKQYKPRLMHVKKLDRNIAMTEVSLKKGNLTSADVFIIDTGLVIYQWNGSECTHDEKFKAAQEAAKMKDGRGGVVQVETLEEGTTAPGHPALAVLKEGKSKEKAVVENFERKMFKVSDADGSLDMDEVATGSGVSKDKLNDSDVFIIDLEQHCFCWVGSAASIDERRNGLAYACNYINKTENPCKPISVVAQGKETSEFNQSF